jgi:hypothetical protein
VSVNFLPRRLGLLGAATGAVMCLVAVPAPAAFAATAPAVPVADVSVGVSAYWPLWCKPAHTGRNWRWHDTRRGGHWDHREWNRWSHRVEWRHDWRDNRFCAPRRPDGPPTRGDGRPGGQDGQPHHS